MIQFERQTCANLRVSFRLEWLETNGIGGFYLVNDYRSEYAPVSWPAHRSHETTAGPDSIILSKLEERPCFLVTKVLSFLRIAILGRFIRRVSAISNSFVSILGDEYCWYKLADRALLERRRRRALPPCVGQ